MDTVKPVCPVCHQTVLRRYYFCPNCGRNLRPDAKGISLLTQIGLYALSLLLPPLGLWPGIKYIMKPNKQAKKVGLIVLALTLVSTIISIRIIFYFAQSYFDQLNSVLSVF